MKSILMTKKVSVDVKTISWDIDKYCDVCGSYMSGNFCQTCAWK